MSEAVCPNDEKVLAKANALAELINASDGDDINDTLVYFERLRDSLYGDSPMFFANGKRQLLEAVIATFESAFDEPEA